eukprot:44615-Eustigmatos_ZCMA.PRE.1
MPLRRRLHDASETEQYYLGVSPHASANNVHKIAAATTPLVLAMVLLNFNPLLATFWLVFFNLQVLCQE